MFKQIKKWSLFVPLLCAGVFGAADFATAKEESNFTIKNEEPSVIQITAEQLRHFYINMLKPNDDTDNNENTGENSGEPFVSEVKVAAERKLCMDPFNGGTYDCGVGDCPVNAAITDNVQMGEITVTVTCQLDCTGQHPDTNGVCDCPIELNADGSQNCTY